MATISRLQLQYNLYLTGTLSNGERVIAGFSTAKEALTSGIDYRGLVSELGWMKGNRAAVVFRLYERN